MRRGGRSRKGRVGMMIEKGREGRGREVRK